MKKLLSKQFWDGKNVCHFEYRNPQPPFPLHSHDFHEIAFVYSGKGIHFTEDGETEISKGSVISVKKGQVHGFKDCESLSLINLMIDCNYFIELQDFFDENSRFKALFLPSHDFSSDSASQGEIEIFRLNELQISKLKNILDVLQNEISDSSEFWNLACKNQLLALIIFLLRVYEDPNYPDMKKSGNGFRMVQYVRENFMDEISSDDFCRMFNMSQSTVTRVFKRITGFTPSDYIIQQRMIFAAQELSCTEKDITQIAYDSGFNDGNYFTRRFKAFFGMPPSDYRKQFTRRQ